MPSFAERARRVGRADRRRGHARRRREVPALARPDPRGRRGRDASPRRRAATRRAGAEDLDLGARHASSTRLGELAARLTPRYRWDDLVLPERQRELLGADLRLPAPPRPRALRVGLRAGGRAHPGAEGAVRRRVGHRQDDGRRGARPPSSGSSSSASTSPRSSPSTSARRRRTSTASSRPPTGSNAILFFDEADALFGKRSRGLGRARPLRQHRGRLPAAEDGAATRAP